MKEFSTKTETSELCGEVVDYKAFQAKGCVALIAYGFHPTSGFEVSLQRKPIEIFPPEFALTHTKPTGPVAQVVTHFVVGEQFDCVDRIEQLKTEDASGKHIVPVDFVDSQAAG